MNMEHTFTATIRKILKDHFGINSEKIFETSLLIRYINLKTRSANRGTKARSSFANIYALYALVEDYIGKGFLDTGKNYAKYKGANFTDLLKRARSLPFGSKLQNHAFNSRLNDEFKKFFPECLLEPILRIRGEGKYWINEQLLKIEVDTVSLNVSQVLIEIIDEYIKTKKDSFNEFIETCKIMQKVSPTNDKEIRNYICSLLQPNVDARVFEIVSYAILKQHYAGIPIYWGWSIDKIKEENLRLFKTGRTNANDGGIDFVMKPMGRFFQVTETTDVKKYFLDIDKVQKYPITFVIKTIESIDKLLKDIEAKARQLYPIDTIVQKYMDSIEEIINIPVLLAYLDDITVTNDIIDVFQEIITQSEVEFNFGSSGELP